jgi:hypothetical protein
MVSGSSGEADREAGDGERMMKIDMMGVAVSGSDEEEGLTEVSGLMDWCFAVSCCKGNGFWEKHIHASRLLALAPRLVVFITFRSRPIRSSIDCT